MKFSKNNYLTDVWRMYRPVIVFLGVLLFYIPASQAQQYNTLYWMQGIPQSTYANPGIQPNAGFFLGFPAASSIYFGLANTGFALQDVIKQGEQNRFYIDDESMLSKLRDLNLINVDYQHELLAFGFRTGSNYFAFSATEKVSGRLGYSKGLMDLLINGNDQFVQQSVIEGRDVPAELKGLSLDLIHYREFGLSWSRKWTEQISAGLRLKALQGMGNVHSERSDLNLFTRPDYYELFVEADMLLHTNLPWTLAPLDSIADKDFELEDEDIVNYLTSTRNMGWGVDLGAVFHVNDRFSIAASALDLGFVNWKSNPENFGLKGDVEFEGVDLNDFIGSDQMEDFDEVLDSIIDLFERKETAEVYRTLMSPKVFISAAYNLTTMHKFAVLGRGEFFKGALYPSFTASYNFQPIRQFGTSFSWSVIHGNYSHLGFGVHINLGPLQIYTVADNFLAGLRPQTFQTANIHVGVNFVGRTKSRLDAAKPSIRW